MRRIIIALAAFDVFYRLFLREPVRRALNMDQHERRQHAPATPVQG